jgi:AcrR family transcriptional regulator
MNADHSLDATRGRLLEAAFVEIYRRGFQAAGLAEILRDTGLTKGALYYHFPSKHALGLAVIDEVIQARLVESVFRPLEEAAQPITVLLQILEQRNHRLDDDTIRCGCPLNNLIQEMSPVDPLFREHLVAILARWERVLRNAFVKAQEQGEVRADIDCADTALFVLAAWEGCWGVAKNHQTAAVFRRCVTRLQDYIRGLLVTPGG